MELISSSYPPYSIKNMFCFFFINKPEEKHGNREQREELESDLADVASEAEENPPSIPTEDKESTQNQVSLKEDVSSETQRTVSPPCPTRPYSGRGRPPKTTPSSAPKKVSVKKEMEKEARDAPGFQDDPSDTDYAPSKYLFIGSPRICS